MTATATSIFKPIFWEENKVRMIDQTRLPLVEDWLEISDYRGVIEAIKEMRIRGAPAIGIAGAYGVALAAIEFAGEDDFLAHLEDASQKIAEARPTGANLAWAVHRMMRSVSASSSSDQSVKDLIAEATKIHDEDIKANLAMGRFGADLIPHGSALLTHCNTGALATGGYGTALGVIQTAWDDGRITHVYADETRPFLQGARLTAWELVRANIDATLIPDSSAGRLMRLGKIQAVIVGADRITANGDVANKIGTYSLAVLAKENNVPFYVAAPTTTIDMSLPSGDSIQIEERPPEEVTHIGGVRIAPEGIGILNTAFDVAPHQYITGIITEKGVAREPYTQSLAQIMEAASVES